MANINEIVAVNTVIETGGLLRRDFGITLQVTTDDTLQSSDPLRIYQSLDAVAADFATTSRPYLAAQAYFGQSPTPKNFMIGRWFNTDYSANLIGGQVPDLSDITPISDGSLNINGADYSGMDFTAATSYADVAIVLSNAIADVAATYDATNGRFVLTSTLTGAASSMTYATATGTDTDVSSLLGLSDEIDPPYSTAIQLNPGLNAQTIEEAMENFEAINDIFYFITLDTFFKDTQTVLDLSVWVAARLYMYFAESSDVAALQTNDVSSIPAQLFAQQSSRVTVDWTPATSSSAALVTDNLAVSSAARLSSVNFSGVNTLINPNFKNRPGFEPSSLTDSQQAELRRKRVNYYTTVGGGTISPTVQNIYQIGTTCQNGVKQQIRFGVDWLQNAIQVNVFDLLLEDDNLPQTVQGQVQVQDVITNVCAQAVRNGLSAPGEVSEGVKNQIQVTTGNADFTGFLSAGYLVYFLPLSTLTTQERIEGKLPLFYVWVKSAGFVDSVDINLIFVQ